MGTAVNIRETAVLCGVSFDVLHGITRGSVILHGLCSLYGEFPRFSSKKRPKSIARGRMMRDYKSYEWPMNRSSGILNGNVSSWESHIINCDRIKGSLACMKIIFFKCRRLTFIYINLFILTYLFSKFLYYFDTFFSRKNSSDKKTPFEISQ